MFVCHVGSLSSASERAAVDFCVFTTVAHDVAASTVSTKHDIGQWRKRMTLQAANAFAPAPPFWIATSAMWTHTNFEIFITEPTTARLIWTICHRFRALFASGAIRGRMELRFGKSKQFLDFDLVGRSEAHVFDLVREIYGRNVTMQLHRGKAQVSMCGHVRDAATGR